MALVPAAEDEEEEAEEEAAPNDGRRDSGDNDDGSSSDSDSESESTGEDSTPADSASAAGDDAAEAAAAQSSDDDGSTDVNADAKAKTDTAARQEEEGEAAKDPRIALITRSQLLRKFLELCPSTLYSADGRRVRTVVGFVGYPNVGKSSTINVLCGQKRVAVAATPGKTKHFQVWRWAPPVCG